MKTPRITALTLTALLAACGTTPPSKPQPLGFSSLDALPTDVPALSNVITVSGLAPNEEVQVSLEGDASGGIMMRRSPDEPWSPWFNADALKSTPLRVRNGDQLRARITTADSEGGTRSMRLILGSGPTAKPIPFQTKTLNLADAPRLHVAAEGGSDQNPGTATKPLATLKHALKQAKSGITLVLLNGKHVINEPLNITQSVTLRGEEQEMVRIVYTGSDAAIKAELEEDESLTLNNLVIETPFDTANQLTLKGGSVSVMENTRTVGLSKHNIITATDANLIIRNSSLWTKGIYYINSFGGLLSNRILSNNNPTNVVLVNSPIAVYQNQGVGGQIPGLLGTVSLSLLASAKCSQSFKNLDVSFIKQHLPVVEVNDERSKCS
ncbi:hypothetical protein HNR42_002218 [Deinobacterium chartae]|uniref:DUF1565 domain-containing protein n=1 Tax=Deinobacterium chartae TaxID=521158 RepID=A0A841I0P8_9DEIO|nr:hypothetical protein [Deinobacterium chartae]MBB6098783.1 hypothetical protein [Deinobacterium chartae]